MNDIFIILNIFYTVMVPNPAIHIHLLLGILGKLLCVNHTLFILYLDGNHTLFGEKLYFIWKFSSGNTDTVMVPNPAIHVHLLLVNYTGILTSDLRGQLMRSGKSKAE